ncbi:PadR family transcriptional regulator [Deinococcus radiophilus]|uniref:PadR family transcriptional regulator n=1 Tax=Deinococcus radiophilus TaxID=32062 RepID=A0A431W5J6_9DEIO|nr:PadR family transcriptional regulator [Deinococcus radiophilus]RTR30710.1 PadR family transcriptional regulator [Deinococcus radiophilus]UFA51263.1 PadR family transcriptional regulator [Deinococcus radiophilus]
MFKRTRKPSPHTCAVLLALLDAYPRPTYGYDLSQTTTLKSGTLYPILQRLHERDLLSAEWQDSPHEGKPPRHIYTLSAAGLKLAREQREADAQAGAQARGKVTV